MSQDDFCDFQTIDIQAYTRNSSLDENGFFSIYLDDSIPFDFAMQVFGFDANLYTESGNASLTLTFRFKNQTCRVSNLMFVLDLQNTAKISLELPGSLKDEAVFSAGRHTLQIYGGDLNEWGISNGNSVRLTVERAEGPVQVAQIKVNSRYERPAAMRALLVTRDNRVGIYRTDVVPGIARGRANQVAQWMAVVLDEYGDPLTAFGNWDPRLITWHYVDDQHSLVEIDTDTAFLFDLVIPFNYGYNGGVPREILLYDQEVQMLIDIDLTPAIERYCEQVRSADPACITLRDTPKITRVAEDIDLGIVLAPYDRRQEATTTLGLERLFDSPRVGECVSLEPLLPRTEVRAQLQRCGALTW